MPTPPRKRLVWIEERDLTAEDGKLYAFECDVLDASDLLGAAKAAMTTLNWYEDFTEADRLYKALRKGQS